jgi:hypothetical protein
VAKGMFPQHLFHGFQGHGHGQHLPDIIFLQKKGHNEDFPFWTVFIRISILHCSAGLPDRKKCLLAL